MHTQNCARIFCILSVFFCSGVNTIQYGVKGATMSPFVRRERSACLPLSPRMVQQSSKANLLATELRGMWALVTTLVLAGQSRKLAEGYWLEKS